MVEFSFVSMLTQLAAEWPRDAAVTAGNDFRANHIDVLLDITQVIRFMMLLCVDDVALIAPTCIAHNRYSTDSYCGISLTL